MLSTHNREQVQPYKDESGEFAGKEVNIIRLYNVENNQACNRKISLEYMPVMRSGVYT